jgi:hypothetical protein
MLKFSHSLNFFIFIFLFGLGYDNANSSATIVALQEKQTGLFGEAFGSGSCTVEVDSKNNEIKLSNVISTDKGARARCIIRANVSSEKKVVRLVPLALKGEVKKAPATVSISLIVTGGALGIAKALPSSYTFTKPAKFNLINKISKTNYFQGNATVGINLILTGGTAEITEMRFALQEKK